MAISPELILGWAGCGTMLFCYIIPIVTFVKLILRKVKYDEIPIAGITAIFVNCLCWIIYANMIKSNPIKYCCFGGFGISGLYIVIYLIYEAREFLLDAILNLLIVITGTYTLHQGLTVLFLEEKTLARICAMTNMVLFFSPIYVLFETCKSKNYKNISLFFSICFMISCILWCCYSAIVKNLYIFAPKVFGIFISLVEIIVWKVYKNKYKAVPEYEKKNASRKVNKKGGDDNTEGSGLTSEKMEFDTGLEKNEPAKVTVKVINEE